MAILVDGAIWRRVDRPGMRFAHLVSDAGYDELHEFASHLGVDRALFQRDHYDIPAPLRAQAITLGAEPVTAHELLRRLKAAGLRRSRRSTDRTRDQGEQAPSASVV